VKLAIAHDWFNGEPRGAENVALELADLFPDAPVHTLMFDERIYGEFLDPARVHTSFLQRAPAVVKSHPRYLLPLIPRAVRDLHFDGYDIVLSNTSGYVQNITTDAATRHVCMCHTPLRFAWGYGEQFLDDQGVDPVRRVVARRLVDRIRRWDVEGARRVDVWLANSHHIAERIQETYGVASTVVYPPVHVEDRPERSSARGTYFLTLSGLSAYKRIDLAIEACNRLGAELRVVGSGPDRRRLESLAGPTIRFEGYVDEATKLDLLAGARALIFPGEEDFGIAPVEAMAEGTPVVAFGVGGLTETVIDGTTGVFFREPTAEALMEAMRRLETLDFDPAKLRRQAERFGRPVFRRAISRVVEQVAAGGMPG
jgi:glycosyltransferase involved in cell wall biosynthesis